MAFNIFVTALAVFVALTIYGHTQGADVISQNCIGCICEASSGCKKTEKCVRDICGAFHIIYSYWLDGGKPKVNGQTKTDRSAYGNCTSDYNCAVKAVQGYMTKYKEDCDGNGKIDCDDFMHIHYLGNAGCKGKVPTSYTNAYSKCKKRFSKL